MDRADSAVVSPRSASGSGILRKSGLFGETGRRPRHRAGLARSSGSYSSAGYLLNYYTRKYPVDDAYARPIGPDVVSAILICSRHGTQRCKTNLITLIFVLLFLRILLEVRIIVKVPSILGVRKNALQLDCIDEDHTDHSHAADGN